MQVSVGAGWLVEVEGESLNADNGRDRYDQGGTVGLLA